MSSRGNSTGPHGRGDRGRRGNIPDPRGNNQVRGRGNQGSQTTYGGFGTHYNRGASRDRNDRNSSRGPGSGGRGQTQQMQIFQQANRTPDTDITEIENAAVASDPDKIIQSLTIQSNNSPPIRPGYGTRGDKIVLYANYFQLAVEKSVPMHRYAISIDLAEGEDRPTGKKMARIVELLLRKMNKMDLLATDHSATIITVGKLEDDSKVYNIPYSYDDSHDSNHPHVYKLTVKYDRSFEMQQLIDQLSTPSINLNADCKQDVIQALNIILSHGLKGSSLVVSQKNKYFPFLGDKVQEFTLGLMVMALRGYFFSVRPAAGRILLNAQIKHLAAYEQLELVKVFSNLGCGPNANADVVRRLARFVKNMPVNITHLDRPRRRTVFGLAKVTDGKDLKHPPRVAHDNAKADKVEFWIEGKGYVTVAQHFQDNHNRRSNLPVVNLGTGKDPSYFLAEVCTVPKGVPYRSRLDEVLNSAMIKLAVRKPYENAISLTTRGPSIIRDFSGEKLNLFGVGLDPSLVAVDSRLLAVPNVQYLQEENRRITYSSAELNNGSWKTFKVQFTKPAGLPDWSFLWVKLANYTDKDGNKFESLLEVEKTVGEMHKYLGFGGVKGKKASKGHQLEIETEADCEGAIDAMFKDLSNSKSSPKLILVILPKKSTKMYNAIKRAGDITWGLHTICVVESNFSKVKNGPYFNNVAMKFNLKLGGGNQRLADESLEFLKDGVTMMVGLDVTHPAPGEDKAPSVSAVVASIDRNFGQWPADIRIQKEQRKEMIDDLEQMIITRLKLWKKYNNNVYPEEILVYRDGVSEGQYDLVRDQELPQIRKACKTLYPPADTKANKPRISIVIVGKRHHTRFYPTSKENADSKGNIKNGTVVDRGVTETRIWDFYLTAHQALQGTARPAHYIVVHDEIFRARAKKDTTNDGRSTGQKAADLVEKVTHNLCYMFGRATTAVSVCPPAYYADVACERARRYLSRVYGDYNSVDDQSVQEARAEEVKVHEKLKDTMFYI